MDCSRLKDFVTDGLGREERDAFIRHMLDCPSCSKELESHEKTWSALGLLDGIETSESFHHRFQARLKASLGTRDIRQSRSKGWFRLVGAAAAVLLIAALVTIGLVSGPASTGNGAGDEMESAGTGGGGEVSRRLPEVTDNGKVVYVVAGKRYELTPEEHEELLANLDLFLNDTTEFSSELPLLDETDTECIEELDELLELSQLEDE